MDFVLTHTHTHTHTYTRIHTNTHTHTHSLTHSLRNDECKQARNHGQGIYFEIKITIPTQHTLSPKQLGLSPLESLSTLI